jgi:hypothetical protein
VASPWLFYVKEKVMKLLTDELLAALLANAMTRKQESGPFDSRPVVKLFTPDGVATWLLTEVDPDDPDLAFGLCDLGMGYPELGYVSLTELAEARGRLGLPVERDLCFRANKPLSAYLEAALEGKRYA